MNTLIERKIPFNHIIFIHRYNNEWLARVSNAGTGKTSLCKALAQKVAIHMSEK